MKTKFAAIALVLASGLIAGTPALAGMTREQVKAELTEAIRTGNFMISDNGQKCNEAHPSMHPAV